MRSNIKKILVLVPSFLLVIVLISGFLIYQKIAHKDDIQEVLWDYNDNVSGTRLWDINGNEVPFPGSQNNIVMFLSSDCGHCLDSLSLYEKVNRIICNNQDVNLLLLWEDKIPKSAVEKHHLTDNSYSLRNVRIGSGYGYCYYVDSKDRVKFADNSGLKNVLLYIKENVQLNNIYMMENANNYFLDKYADNKTTLIYFSMPGCPDCAEATEYIQKNNIEQLYNMVRIELERGSKTTDLIDECDIYRTAYAIDWYPSFLILHPDGKHQIIRRVEMDELVATLLTSATQTGA